MEKIFIVSGKSVNKLEIANEMVNLDDSLDIANVFVSDEDYIDDFGNTYYKTNEDVCLDYKNNSLLYITSVNDWTSRGVDINEFYNKDIFCLDYIDFNNIAVNLVKDYEILVVWVDSTYDKSKVCKDELHESKYFMENIDKAGIPYLYFIESEITNVAEIVTEYINGDADTKQRIISENS